MTELATSDKELRQLAEAFTTFSVVSTQLEASYLSLEQRMAELREQLRAAEARRRAETRSKHLLAARMQTVLEALPGAVVVLDEAGRVSESNSIARAWLGELRTGESWSDISARAFEPALSEHGDLLQKGGRRLVLTQQALADEAGRILLLTDVTEQRQLNEVIERHRRLAALGEMVATLAHQIRTPVTSALLYTSNAARADIDQARRMLLVEKASGCLHDLEKLINDMLLFAGGHAASGDTEFTVDALLERVEDAVRPQCRDRQSLAIGASPPGVSIRGNREALAGALQNIVINALQSGASHVDIGVAKEEKAIDVVEIRIDDDGPGIAPDDAEKIFEPFFTRRSGGTGLGLAVARSIVRAHQGEIRLRGTSEPGAHFLIRLPLASVEMTPERAA
jgi:two-component system, sensor histidine kinase FlrB